MLAGLTHRRELERVWFLEEDAPPKPVALMLGELQMAHKLDHPDSYVTRAANRIALG